MKKLEILLYGFPILIVLIAVAASPWLALAVVFNGLVTHAFGPAGFLALGYLIFLILLLALASPVFKRAGS